VLIRRSPGSSPGGFKTFKQTATNRDAPVAKQRRLFLGHHRRHSGKIQLTTVRPPVQTVVKPA